MMEVKVEKIFVFNSLPEYAWKCAMQFSMDMFSIYP